jgi:fucose permease
VSLLYLWGDENGPWMQALHFIFGIGAVVGPQLVAPFLAPQGTTTMESGLNTSTFLTTASEEHQNMGLAGNSSVNESSRLHIPYGIGGIMIVVCSIMFLFMFIKDRHNNTSNNSKSVNKSNKTGEIHIKQLQKLRLAIISLVFCFYLAYCTVEIQMASFLFMFCVNYVGWSKTTAAYLTSTFWASFTISRGIGIILIKYVKPHTLIFADITIFIIGLTPSIFAVLWHPAVIRVCTVVVGAVFASGISWTDEHIKVTEAVGSIFLVACAVTDLYGPVVLVYLMEEVSYMLFYLPSVCIWCCLSCHHVLSTVTR